MTVPDGESRGARAAGRRKVRAMAGDWIKLHRKLLDSPLMKHDGLLRLWCYCLLRANWRPGKWLVPGTLRELAVARGQFVTGRRSLHAALYPQRDEGGRPVLREWTPTERTLWRWLEALEGMGCVTLQNVSNRCTLVSVCNYERYQDMQEGECPTGVQPVSNRLQPFDSVGLPAVRDTVEKCPTYVQPKSDACLNGDVSCDETDGGDRPTGVQPVSNRCPTGVQPVTTIEEGKKVRREEENNTPHAAGSFAAFWEAYPRKEARAAALKAFARLAPDKITLDAMLAAVARQRLCGCLEPRVAPDGRSVIPHAATWINGRRWEDAPPPKAGANGHAGPDLFAGVRAFLEGGPM